MNGAHKGNKTMNAARIKEINTAIATLVALPSNPGIAAGLTALRAELATLQSSGWIVVEGGREIARYTARAEAETIAAMRREDNDGDTVEVIPA
jgi:hypothetical protein